MSLAHYGYNPNGLLAKASRNKALCIAVERAAERKRLDAEKRHQEALLRVPRHLRTEIKAICQDHDVGFDEVASASRMSRLQEARRAVVYLFCKKTILSFAAIGNRLSGRDHSTIRHAFHRYAQIHGLSTTRPSRPMRERFLWECLIERLRAGEIFDPLGRIGAKHSPRNRRLVQAAQKRLAPSERIVCLDGVLRLEVGL